MSDEEIVDYWGLKTTEEELKSFREKYAHFNTAEYLDRKIKEHVKKGYTEESFCITDSELEKDLGRFGLFIIRCLGSIGYAEHVYCKPDEFKRRSVKGLFMDMKRSVLNKFSKTLQKTK